MRVWEIKDDEGRTCAVEVPSLAGRRRVTRIIEGVSGVKVIRRPEWFSKTNQDSFCEFELDGERFEVIEPFGDNSRFLISREECGWNAGFERVVQTLAKAGLWFG